VNQSEFLARVFTWCAGYKVLAHWCGDSRRCQGDRGLPDLILAGLYAVMYREVKRDQFDTLSPQQVTWKHTLMAAGVDYAVWYYADLEAGTVEREIERLSRP
jgi:hypothetical protein